MELQIKKINNNNANNNNHNRSITHSKCEYTNSGTFTFPNDVSYDSKELSNDASTFRTAVDITGLTTLDLTGNEYAGIVVCLGNTTETIDSIINHPPVQLLIAPRDGMALTVVSTNVSTAVAGDICLENNTSIVLNGRDGDLTDFLLTIDSGASNAGIIRQVNASIL